MHCTALPAGTARASGHEKRLALVEVHAAHRAVVLVKAVYQCAHTEVPELHHAAVQGRQNPWPPRVEGQPLHAVALRLKLRPEDASEAAHGVLLTRLAVPRRAKLTRAQQPAHLGQHGCARLHAARHARRVRELAGRT